MFDVGSPAASEVRVAPRTIYNTARIRQEFGRLTSTTSLLVTNVHRDLAASDPLAAYIARNAFTMAGDAVLKVKGGEYEISLLAGMNHITGEREAIERLQRSSVHYFQRPDRRISPFDPNRTSIDGYRTHAAIERRNARHWLWDTTITLQSPGMDMNDIGRTFNGTASPIRPSPLPGSSAQPLLRAYTRHERHQRVISTVSRRPPARPSVNITLRTGLPAAA